MTGPTPASAPSPAVAVRVAHEMPGRLRARLTRPMTAEELPALVDRIAACPGITRVVGRPNTGSLIVEDRGSAGSILRLLREHGVITVAADPVTVPADLAAQLLLAQADIEIEKRTSGVLSLHSALAFVLLAGAVIQVFRGNVAGPATALAVSALTLLERPGE